MTISVLVPSRGRPQALQEMADSVHATAVGPVEVLAYVDDDDPADYSTVTGVRIIYGPRIVLSDCWNQLAAAADGPILGMGADDIRFRTVGWDTRVCRAFEVFDDQIAFVYGRDGIHDQKLGTHGFIHWRWVETVGYFTWPEFPADYADTWLHELAGRIRRLVYLPDVYIEHLHFLAGKAEVDQTHRERLARRGNVDWLWRTLTDQRIADARKLEEACFS